MTLNVIGVFNDAWKLWKRDRELLIGVAGFFLFVPQLALKLFVPLPPDLPDFGDAAKLRAWVDAAESWSSQYSLIVILLWLVTLFGSVAVFTLYLDPDRPEARRALARALRLSPRFLLLTILVALPVQFGLIFLLLPGFYAQGRLLLALPAVVAEQPQGALASISRSMALTRGHGMVLAGMGCIVLLAGDLLSRPFIAIGRMLGGAPMANPVVAGLLDTGAAAGVTVALLGGILIQVALYRRLVSSRGI
ncbi:MAG: hypothetical protein ABIY39_10235 [Sphingomonas sp.]